MSNTTYPLRRRRIIAGAAAALVLTASCAFAAPGEADPVAAASDADYAAGKQALERNNWPEAKLRFELAARRDPNNADLQNYLGYAHRKLGQYDLALRFYERAIELNPRHRGAHEYIGETYLMIGDLANADKHLAALREICLLPCEELDDLDKAVTQYRTRARTPQR